MEYEFYVIEADAYFILPDTSCVPNPGQLQPYTNQFIREIIQIGIPLTDKIFLLANSSKLGINRKGIQYIRNAGDVEMVMKFNRSLFRFARKGVACKCKKYLQSFINLATFGLTSSILSPAKVELNS